MKVLLFCLKGFETMEFSPFVDVMGWARNDYGYDVEVVTCGFQRQVTSTFGITVQMDRTIDEIWPEDYDALAVPGGFEEFDFYEEAYSDAFCQLVRRFNALHKPIASVCVGALPLGKSGVLNGRPATTFHLGNGCRQKQLAEFGAQVVNQRLVIDDNVITSYCPETAPDVAFALLELLLGAEAAKTVRAGMGFS